MQIQTVLTVLHLCENLKLILLKGNSLVVVSYLMLYSLILLPYAVKHSTVGIYSDVHVRNNYVMKMPCFLVLKKETRFYDIMYNQSAKGTQPNVE